MNAEHIFVGTAGWSYPDWAGTVYPRTATADRLRTVAGCVDCVEVDSSFYHPPTAQMTANWARRVARQSEFRFLAKAWQRFTHERTARWTQTEFDHFARGFAPLREAGRLELLLFQFPWSFRHNAANQDWLCRLADDFTGWPMAVELRHDSWLTDDVLALLRSRRISFCNIDQPALAHCLPPTAVATTGIGYYRLHGRNAQNWFQQTEKVYGGRYDYLYSDVELADLLVPIRRVAAQTTKTFVIFNNHKDGKALANALQLKARLEPGVPARAPATLLTRFPALRGSVQPDDAEQLPLID